MALYDSTDLLQRCKDGAQLPTVDEAMPDAAWFRLLTSVQGTWYPQIATHAPGALIGAPVRLTSDDAGLTYTFGTDNDGRPITPFAVELYRREEDAYQPGGASGFTLRNGVDYTAESGRIRFRLTGTRPTFPDGGPWARYIDPPGVIDATHQPVLYPLYARELLVLGAVEGWATQGGLRDPSPWVGSAQKLWTGDGGSNVGLLGALKLQYPAPSMGGGRYMVIPRGYSGAGR